MKRSRVIKILKPPITARDTTDNFWGRIPVESVQYDGLLIQFSSGSPLKPSEDPEVVRIVISKSKWNTRCGVKVGTSESAMLKILGQPIEIVDTTRGSFYHYFAYPNDASVEIFFEKGLVTRIELVQDPSSP